MSNDTGLRESSGMKIAIIGSAPSSVHLAPYGDPSWTIWGCSPGAAAVVKRADAWFEIHPLSDEKVFTPDYMAWLGKFPKPVYTTGLDPRVPNAVVYPKDEMVAKHGRYFFTSSVAWMLALALEHNPSTIGLWGIDMSAVEEYSQQRPGCHFFLQLAASRGIQVITPAESDLLRPPMLYGFGTDAPIYQKLRARAAELDARIVDAANRYENARNEWNFLKGARDDLEYVMKTWVD
jgi:hypothetical protein